MLWNTSFTLTLIFLILLALILKCPLRCINFFKMLSFNSVIFKAMQDCVYMYVYTHTHFKK